MKVLFVCSGGMSSAIVVNALKRSGENGVNMEVHAIGTNEVEEEVKNGWDVVMVAPQIRHRFDSVKICRGGIYSVWHHTAASIHTAWRPDFIKTVNELIS